MINESVRAVNQDIPSQSLISATESLGSPMETKSYNPQSFRNL